MARFLILSRSKDSLLNMKQFLTANNETDVCLMQDIAMAKTVLRERHFDIILYDFPFTEEKHEISFLLNLGDVNNAFIIVVVSQPQYTRMKMKVETYGIFTIVKPIQNIVLDQLLGFAKAANYRYSQYERRNERLLDKIKEIKLVDRAKCLLIENEFMSENDAHKKIEQSAMNSRMTRYEVAKSIVDRYEDE